MIFNVINCVVAKVVIPERGSLTFVSTIGQLDGRIDLYRGWNFVEHLESIDSVNSGSSGSVKINLGSRGLMDLCVMASKLAYENAKVVENVVNLHWKASLLRIETLNTFHERKSFQLYKIFIS